MTYIILKKKKKLALRARWLFYHFISNSGSWNNCYVLPFYTPGWMGYCSCQSKKSYPGTQPINLARAWTWTIESVVYRHATWTKETNISNERNRVKNPNWQEADQLAIYKARPRNWTLKKSLEPGTSGLQHQCPKPLGHTASCLLLSSWNNEQVMTGPKGNSEFCFR